ncbi:MAG: RluA family pseudouridine synthase [Lachnospiraceae bacterium]|nr:RluA family pseudouridine synthase [Lachnospiraceae bacterium]
MEDLRIIIEENYNEAIGVRIDKFLTDELTDYSRSYIQKLLNNGCITANSKPVKANYKLKSDDIIDIDIPEPEIIEIVPKDIPINIVYEDKDLIVVDKPKGMVVHPAPGHYDDTLVNALMYHCKDLSTINGVMRPGIVHRIDMDTSGLLVICKNDTAHRIMSEKFKIHDINRIYTAICHNHFKESEGTIDKPIARHRTDRKKMAIDERGRRAVTHYKVIASLKDNMSLIECKLETGRTHQIRVHMASINHSLLGDEIYGTKSKKFNLNGQTLHAGVLGFTHPITNEYMEFHSDLPDYFKNILKVLES